MNNIIPFISKPSIQRQKALEKLVEHYKAFMQEPLENPLDVRQAPWKWGEFRWQGLGRFMKIEFSSSLGSTQKKLPPHMALPNKTLHEIQAMALHFIAMNSGVSDTKCSDCIRGLLIIELVLRTRSVNGIANFSDLKASDLDNAIQVGQKVRNSTIPPTLEDAQNLLIVLGIVTSGSVKNWINTLRRKHKRDYNQSNRSQESKNLLKLPNLKAVNILADYFASQPWLTKGEAPVKLDNDPKNIIVSSVLAILSLVPCRIEEVLKNLSVNCLTRQPESSVGNVLGIHWYSDKSDLTHTKWVPYTVSGVFEEVIEEAIARLKYVTEDARTLLRKWDSTCPEYNETEYQLAKQDNRLPAGWPWFEKKLKLRFSDALFVCLKHQMASKRNTIHNRIQIIKTSNFRDWLRTKESKNSWSGEPLLDKGFFDRIGHSGLNLKTDDYNSHSYRHMVNTAARLGGTNEFEVNIWSHRKRQGEGEVYNHTTGEQRRNLILHGDYKGKKLSPKERLAHINNHLPMTRKNLGMRFEIIGNSFGGFTFNHPLGTCVHNYAEGPCLRNMDCALCPENLHCKGDKRTLKNLNHELEKSNTFLQMAISNNDQMGLNRFEVRSEILNALTDILGDSSPLADGDLVILAPQDAPKAGLLERARLIAEQIKVNQAKIEQQHTKTKDKLGVTRSLTTNINTSANQDVNNSSTFDAVVDDFLLGLEEED